MPQGVLATVLNGNDEGAALHANDVGMDKWGRGGQNGLLFQKYKKILQLVF